MATGRTASPEGVPLSGRAEPVIDRNEWLRLLRRARGGELAAQPQRIAELCVDTLGVNGAGISLVSDTGHRGLVCATDEISRRIEDLQISLGEGPCIDTVRTGAPVLVADLGARGDIAAWRWPAFIAAATGAGVRAVFAFPLRIGAIGVGALDMYRDQPGALDDAELSAALIGAEAAAVALLGLKTSPDGTLADTTDVGVGYQAQIHQATGMVMVQLGVTIEQAFVLLRARSFATGRPLHDLAVDVIRRRLRFSPEDL
jgi:hypothetical protein